MKSFTEYLKENVLILDGGMGTMVQRLGLTDQDYGGAPYKMLADIIAFSRPGELKNIHLEYLKAGANIIETNTFGASGLRLKEFDLTGLDTTSFQGLPEGLNITQLSCNEFARELNKKAAQLACDAIKEYCQLPEYNQRPLFAFGCIGPSNYVLTPTMADLKKGSYEQIVNNFYHQVLGLLQGGVHGIIYDTSQDPLELKAAIHGGQKAMADFGKKVPIVAHVTVDRHSKMSIFNTNILAAMATVEGIGIDAFGINCSIGPDLMEPTIKKLSLASSLPISIMPNAGLPVSENGKTVFKLPPQDLAKTVVGYVKDYGVRLVGGCCGTTPDHIKAVVELMKDVTPQKINKPGVLYVSGPQQAVALNSKDALIGIGERLNVRGSKKVRDAVENGEGIDFDVLEEVVSEQINDLGISIIDVCMDSNLVDTKEAMTKVVSELSKDFKGVMCLDSFDSKVLQEALKYYPGRPIINSISLEEVSNGKDKIDVLVGNTHQHAPVYIALCADDKGPAKTAKGKYEIAKRLVKKCQDEYGVKPAQLIIDVNAFPIGSEAVAGENYALESLNAISKIKSIHPNLKVSIGVGNLTNGLAKKPYMRRVLTSYFLHKGREVGLDVAIINPQHYVPIEALDKEHVNLAHKIIFNHDMDAFAVLEDIALARKGGKTKVKNTYEDLPCDEAVCQKIKDGFKQKQRGVVNEHGFDYHYDDAIVVQVAKSLTQHKPLNFVNDYLMRAMQDLGEGFSKGEVSLPHLLKAADVMKHAMGYVERVLKQTNEGQSVKKGVVVLGTVYQDVHSIGKDLVKTLLENYGYEVVDLGVQVALEKFVEVAKAKKATAIGLSALLVQTSNHMVTVAKLLKEAGLDDVAILIGGAPVNHKHAAQVAMHGQNSVNEILPNVFYCQSAMDGVNVLNKLMVNESEKQKVLNDNQAKLKSLLDDSNQNRDELIKTLPRQYVPAHTWQEGVVKYVPVEKLSVSVLDMMPVINQKTLYSLNWRYGGQKSWEAKGVTKEQLDNQLEEWLSMAHEQGWLQPQALYGIFPCYSLGDELVICDVANHIKELGRFAFNPELTANKKHVVSQAQYFYSKETKKYDMVGLQLVTVGKKVIDQVKKFEDEGNVEGALLLQGLADRLAEDMAETVHGQLRQLLKIDPKQGRRLSPGYPAIKDISVNRLIFNLLTKNQNIDVALTEANVFIPTSTTAAVVCFRCNAYNYTP